MVMAAIRDFFTMQPAPVPLHEERAFVTGPATVDRSQQVFGIPNDQFQPPEYKQYIATSNAVYACTMLRSRTLANLPLKVYRVSGKDNKTEITSGPLWDLLHKVNPYWTLGRLIDMTEQSLCIWGECFWFMEKKGTQPVELWWAAADRVTVHPHPTQYISHFTYEVSGQKIPFQRDETIWLRRPNIIDQYSGLSPLAAARLSADTASASMHSNFNIHRNGSNIAGLVVPLNGGSFSEDQGEEISNSLTRKFKGVDNSHKLAVLRFAADFKAVQLSPKEAEFLGLLKWTLEDICRAYNVPIDKVGGERTYQNVEGSDKALYTDCIIPEARFIADELTEQLLPHFGDHLIAEFDDSGIDVLHEAETSRWEREAGQLDRGAITINQWRKDQGMPTVAWGDVAWMDGSKIPIDSPEKPLPQLPALMPGQADDEDDALPEGDKPKALSDGRSRTHSRMVAYGSEEHQRLWNRYLDFANPYETQWGRMTADLLRRQRDSVMAQFNRITERSLKREPGQRELQQPDDILAQAEALIQDVLTEDMAIKLEEMGLNPFDLPRWIKTFRVESKELTTTITEAAANLAANEVGFATGFNVKDPHIINGIERQVQKFAEAVNETTWQELKDTIQEGIRDGDSIDKIAQRIGDVMEGRTQAANTLVARTEVNRAVNAGTMEGWRQSGVVTKKRWLAALDDRVRATHAEAHGQEVGLDEDFSVGGCSGPAPGSLDCVREVANCRCSMVAVLDVPEPDLTKEESGVFAE